MVLGPQLYRLRAEAEKLLVDTVQVTRREGFTIDPVTSREVPATADVYTGPASMGMSNVQVTGGVQKEVVKFPVGSFQAKAGDLVTWVTAFDPKTYAGLRMRLTGELPSTSVAVLYRMIAERVVDNAG